MYCRAARPNLMKVSPFSPEPPMRSEFVCMFALRFVSMRRAVTTESTLHFSFRRSLPLSWFTTAAEQRVGCGELRGELRAGILELMNDQGDFESPDFQYCKMPGKTVGDRRALSKCT